MDTTSSVNVLSSLSVGTVVQWILFAATVISGFCAIAIKVYKAFEKYQEIKNERDNLVDTVSEHEQKINEVDKKLSVIIEKLNSQDVTTMKKLRRELVKDGERYLIEKKMPIREWKSWMEMFDEYHDKFKQNSYVETLKHKIEREVTITGKLDEHGNDIE